MINYYAMKSCQLIVAMDTARGIGREGQLPWHLPEDLRYFKDKTTTAKPHLKNTLIMGRKTWESLPLSVRPLPGRQNIVVSSLSSLVLPDGVVQSSSLESALDYAQDDPQIETLFIIGGGTLYAAAIHHPSVQTLWITAIAHFESCDTFFPEFEDQFERVESGPVQTSTSGIKYSFQKWNRRNIESV